MSRPNQPSWFQIQIHIHIHVQAGRKLTNRERNKTKKGKKEVYKMNYGI
mgnify:CR=1 FL=1